MAQNFWMANLNFTILKFGQNCCSSPVVNVFECQWPPPPPAHSDRLLDPQYWARMFSFSKYKVYILSEQNIPVEFGAQYWTVCKPALNFSTYMRGNRGHWIWRHCSFRRFSETVATARTAGLPSLWKKIYISLSLGGPAVSAVATTDLLHVACRT